MNSFTWIIFLSSTVDIAACRKGNPYNILEDTFSFISPSPFFCSFSCLLFPSQCWEPQVIWLSNYNRGEKKRETLNLIWRIKALLKSCSCSKFTHRILISSLLKEASFFFLVFFLSCKFPWKKKGGRKKKWMDNEKAFKMQSTFHYIYSLCISFQNLFIRKHLTSEWISHWPVCGQRRRFGLFGLREEDGGTEKEERARVWGREGVKKGGFPVFVWSETLKWGLLETK